MISVPLCCVQSFSPGWESVGEALSGHNGDSQLAAPALQAAKCCQLLSAGRERQALHCCTLGVVQEGKCRLLGTRVRNGKRRDSSSDGGRSVTDSGDVMCCNVCSGPGMLPLLALSHVWLYPEEGAEILPCTLQGLGYEIWIFVHTLHCT